MNERQRGELLGCGTDVDGALYRFGGKEDIYVACLQAFWEDRSIQEFRDAMEKDAWEDACTAVHTLKGVAGNMGFLPLMRAAEQIVRHLRAEQIQEAKDAESLLEDEYRRIIEGVERFFAIEAE